MLIWATNLNPLPFEPWATDPKFPLRSLSMISASVNWFYIEGGKEKYHQYTRLKELSFLNLTFFFLKMYFRNLLKL